MEVEKQIEQKVNEFCRDGNLESYRPELTVIFQRIWDKGCKISARYDMHACSHVFEPGCLIRISFIKPFCHIEEMIWTILHEFGHHLSGYISKREEESRVTKVPRERLAWELARLEVLRYPRLAKQVEDFDRYAALLLEGYIKEYGTDEMSDYKAELKS